MLATTPTPCHFGPIFWAIPLSLVMGVFYCHYFGSFNSAHTFENPPFLKLSLVLLLGGAPGFLPGPGLISLSFHEVILSWFSSNLCAHSLSLLCLPVKTLMHSGFYSWPLLFFLQQSLHLISVLPIDICRTPFCDLPDYVLFLLK